MTSKAIYTVLNRAALELGLLAEWFRPREGSCATCQAELVDGRCISCVIRRDADERMKEVHRVGFDEGYALGVSDTVKARLRVPE